MQGRVSFDNENVYLNGQRVLGVTEFNGQFSFSRNSISVIGKGYIGQSLEGDIPKSFSLKKYIGDSEWDLISLVGKDILGVFKYKSSNEENSLQWLSTLARISSYEINCSVGDLPSSNISFESVGSAGFSDEQLENSQEFTEQLSIIRPGDLVFSGTNGFNTNRMQSFRYSISIPYEKVNLLGNNMNAYFHQNEPMEVTIEMEFDLDSIGSEISTSPFCEKDFSGTFIFNKCGQEIRRFSIINAELMDANVNGTVGSNATFSVVYRYFTERFPYESPQQSSSSSASSSSSSLSSSSLSSASSSSSFSSSFLSSSSLSSSSSSAVFQKSSVICVESAGLNETNGTYTLVDNINNLYQKEGDYPSFIYGGPSPTDSFSRWRIITNGADAYEATVAGEKNILAVEWIALVEGAEALPIISEGICISSSSMSSSSISSSSDSPSSSSVSSSSSKSSSSRSSSSRSSSSRSSSSKSSSSRSSSSSSRSSSSRSSSSRSSGSSGSNIETYAVNFEGTGETKISYNAGNISLSGKTWNLKNALIGTNTLDKKTGARSMRMKFDTLLGEGVAEMLVNTDWIVSSVSFYTAIFGLDAQGGLLNVEYYNGSSWVILRQITVSTTDLALNEVSLPNIGQATRIRFRWTNPLGISERRINIDNITIQSI